MLIGYAGLAAIGVKPGETERGRAAPRAVTITGNAEADAAALEAAAPAGHVDAIVDLSPLVAKDSTHVRSGRACMMGVNPNDLALPYSYAVQNSITVHGQYMYDRHIPRELMKLAETGVLKLGKDGGNEIVGTLPFERFEEALALSVRMGGGFGQSVIMFPHASKLHRLHLLGR
ncbi:hypothetical protein HK405_004733 [Cladochytrium tenue]|nr:hypothetical protein HK405_004733 [Cladochytrium tenue]